VLCYAHLAFGLRFKEVRPFAFCKAVSVEFLYKAGLKFIVWNYNQLNRQSNRQGSDN
jgi:hypothetical protein